MASPEMQDIQAFAKTNGSAAFEKLKKDNTEAFPEFVEELKGIAEGSGVDLDTIWYGNLISELESLMERPPGPIQDGHCSDIYAVSEKGYAGGFAHGHNEDWPGIVNNFFYYVKLTPTSDAANFSSCAGMAYPGAVVGWAATWNTNGIYMTQNSVFPRRTLAGGLASIFVQRKAICGAKPAESLDDMVAGLKIGKWSSGASVNMVDLRNKRMANLEVHEDQFGLRVVTNEMGNYSHFNMYKTLAGDHLDPPSPSTMHRQRRVDALPPSRSSADIVSRLSDTADPDLPLFRNMTITTLILEGATGDLRIFCCGQPAASGKPLYSWNVLDFFKTEDLATAAAVPIDLEFMV